MDHAQRLAALLRADPTLTQAELGAELAITRARVSQIMSAAGIRRGCAGCGAIGVRTSHRCAAPQLEVIVGASPRRTAPAPAPAVVEDALEGARVGAAEAIRVLREIVADDTLSPALRAKGAGTLVSGYCRLLRESIASDQAAEGRQPLTPEGIAALLGELSPAAQDAILEAMGRG